jgi:hypothetical protein
MLHLSVTCYSLLDPHCNVEIIEVTSFCYSVTVFLKKFTSGMFFQPRTRKHARRRYMFGRCNTVTNDVSPLFSRLQFEKLLQFEL